MATLRGQRPLIRSDGKFIRDYFYAEDGSAANMLLAERLAADRNLAGQAFNFSNESQVTVLGLVDRILKLMSSTLEPDVRNEAVNEIRAQYLNTSKARKLLGWKPIFTLDEGLRRTIQVPRVFRSSDLMIDNQATACRSCGYADLQSILSLGRTPLANALLTQEQLGEPDETFPLDLVFCPNCSLVQITETVAPEKLFREYVYFSSFSDTMLRHAEDVATQLIVSKNLDGKSLVVEVASNDGYLLRFYKRAGVPVLGIEPAVNIARVAEQQHGIPTRCAFFNEDLASRLVEEGFQADVIHANNVLAHVPNLNGFIQGLRTLLKQNGVVVIEVPYVKEVIDRCEFDTIYHEHLSYFSLTALDALIKRNGLTIQQVERLAIHGGTLRLYAGHSAAQNTSVTELLENESSWGVNRIDFYSGFSARVERLRDELVTLLQELKAQHKRIAVYGASAKGSTLLNYCGVGRETLDYVVDRSTVKQGLYTPGTRLKIYAPERLIEDMPDYVLLLIWNLAAEVLEQQSEYRNRGGRFIVPVPQVRVV